METLEFTRWLVDLGAAAAGILLWILFKKKGKVSAGTGMGLSVAGVIFLLAADGRLRKELSDIFRGISGSLGEGPEDVTRAGVLLAVILVLAGFLIEFYVHAHWILYLVFTILILLAPLLGHTPGNGAVFLMTVFQLVFWTKTGARHLASKDKDRLKNKISMGMFWGFSGIFY